MRKSDRLFQLTNLLRSHQPMTAKQLAEKLCVSERTIYRYIDDLSLSGIPLYGELGVGYRLSDGFELPPLQLTSDELEALIAGVNFTASLIGKEFADSARALLSKIEAVLPANLTAPQHEKRLVSIPARHCKSQIYPYWDKVHRALKEHCWLTISYTSLSASVTNRTVYPLGLFYWGGKWTLGGWCELRGDYRDFRLDCITDLKIKEHPGVLPKQVSLPAYIAFKNGQVY